MSSWQSVAHCASLSCKSALRGIMAYSRVALMKLSRAAFLIAMLVLASSLVAQTSSQTAIQPAPQTAIHRPRVALALSGGGSLGLAHIGVLQYFEEHHIPVDAIAGTSIGGIVGGLYATGHGPAEIERSFADAGWDELLRVQPRYQDLPMQPKQDRAEHP